MGEVAPLVRYLSGGWAACLSMRIVATVWWIMDLGFWSVPSLALGVFVWGVQIVLPSGSTREQQ